MQQDHSNLQHRNNEMSQGNTSSLATHVNSWLILVFNSKYKISKTTNKNVLVQEILKINFNVFSIYNTQAFRVEVMRKKNIATYKTTEFVYR